MGVWVGGYVNVGVITGNTVRVGKIGVAVRVGSGIDGIGRIRVIVGDKVGLVGVGVGEQAATNTDIRNTITRQ